MRGRAVLVVDDVEGFPFRQLVRNPEDDVGAAQVLPRAVEEDGAHDGPVGPPGFPYGVLARQFGAPVVVDRVGAGVLVVGAALAVKDEVGRHLHEAGSGGAAVLGERFDGPSVDGPGLAPVLVALGDIGHCGAVHDHVRRKVLKDLCHILRLGHVEGRVAARSAVESRGIVSGGRQHVVLAVLAEAPNQRLSKQSVGAGNENAIKQHDEKGLRGPL